MNVKSFRFHSMNIRRTLPFCIVIAIAVILKAYYSRAEADDLGWILAPTARCVELLSGIPFTLECGTGFVNADHRTIIAPACAGINFLIILFCMMSFRLIPRWKGAVKKTIVIGAGFVAAYALAVCINGVRIAVSIHLYDIGLAWGVFTRDRIHRLLGIVVYFGSLCVIYALISRGFSPAPWIPRQRFTSYPAQRNFLVPAAWYLSITLVLPLVLGKYMLYKGQLLEHIFFVCLFPALIYAAGRLKNRFRAVRAGRSR